MAKKMMGWSVWVSGLVVLIMVVSSPSPGSGAIECTAEMLKAIIPKVMPCIGYLKGEGPSEPSEQCCSGAQELDNIAIALPADKKALCVCLKKVAEAYTIDHDRESKLPELCKLKTNIPLSPNVDCNAL